MSHPVTEEDQSHSDLLNAMQMLLPSSKGEPGAPTSKRASLLGKESPNQCRGQSSRKGGKRQGLAEGTEVGHVLSAMARLVIAHEDELNARSQEMELMVFMQSG